MANTQNQDLVFHRDNSLISDLVLGQSANSYLSLITHKRGTSPSWLVNSLIENSLVGSANLINSELKRHPKRSTVYFISFMNSEEFYRGTGVKNGVDFSTSANFKFIDCFSNLFLEIIKNPSSPNASAEFKKYVDTKIIPAINAQESNVIFIESPEFLLSSSLVTSNDLLSIITKLNRLCKQMVILSGQEYPESFDPASANLQDPAFKTADFLTKLYHKSHLNINLQPLPTGRAKDITGCLTVRKGSIPYEGINLQVWEREYIYLALKDRSVKLYFR